MVIDLIALDRRDWQRAAADPAKFAGEHGVGVGVHSGLLREVADQTLALFQRTGVTSQPWSGYLAADRAHGTIVGTGGFKAPPDAENCVEIAYFTFPGFEGQGVASAMALELIQRAAAAGVRRIRAHTLPEGNASTRILEKSGFRKLGEVIDPEDGLVWRWERASLHLTEHGDGVAETAETIAAAIARRDVAALRALLTPDFVHRTHGGARSDAEAFIRAIQAIPGEITSVTLEQLQVDVCASGALVTGVQHARVLVDGHLVDDRRGFVDWFVRHAGGWRIQAAVDLPGD